MRERLDKGLKLGFWGNLLFIAFGFICYIYYLTYDRTSTLSRVLEFVAYMTETAGFAAFLFGDYLIATAVRMRSIFKVFLTLYIVLEAVMMVLELNAGRLRFYAPFSLPLAIVHAVVSAAVCFTFLQLDPHQPRFEALIIVCIGIMLGGMLGNIIGVRVYFSIITNAVGFAVMFAGIRYLLSREEMEIDCHGDNAKASEYSSDTMFKDMWEDKK